MSPEFSPAVFTYSVAIQSETNPVNIDATPEEGFFVEFPLGQQITPLNGNVAIVNAYDTDGLKTSYYIQFVKGELPKAKLSSVMLSAGSVAGFSKDETVYNNIAVPFGVQSVTVFPAGDQDGSYFTPNTASAALDPSAGTGTVTVGVIANGYSQNEYTFNFKRDNGQPSELGTAGIALSGGGALAAAFNPQAAAGTVQTIIVPYDTAELTVIAVKKNGNDTVYFDTGAPSDSKIFTGNLHDKTFSITVNCGIGYTDKTYQFKIQKSTETSAVVTELIFRINDVPVTVNQRTAADDGAALTEGFDSAYNLYNFNFTHDQAHGAENAEISAAAETGAVITVLSGADTDIPAGDSVTIPVAELASSREPVQLHVSAAGKVPNIYTIYFKKTDPPAARLDSVAITGIAGAQPDIANVDGGTFGVNVYANAQFVVVDAGVPGDYAYDVRYENSRGEAHNYLLSPYIAGGHIKVYISGGDDYAESIYTFNFTALDPFNPRLTSLSVGGSSNLITGDVLAYTHALVYSPGPTNIPFTWAAAPGVVSKVQYSLDYGTVWQDGGVSFPSATLFTIGPAESKVTLLKVTALDGAEAVYNITVTKAGDGTNELSGIAVTAPAGAMLQKPDGTTDFDGAVFNYTVLLGSEVTTSTVNVSWPAGDSVVTYTLDGDSATLPGADIEDSTVADSITVSLDSLQKSLTIAVHPQAGAVAANTYTVVFAYAPPTVFNATGSVQTFTAPYTGRYRIECWGAQGGNSDSGGLGGMGGYSYGTKTLAKDAVLYIYAGRKGGDGNHIAYGTGGWNGGGTGGDGRTPPPAEGTRAKGAGGGGASDVRTATGAWDTNFGTRIIVAGGGGGAGHLFSGGAGGGGNDGPTCNGGDGDSYGRVSPGATQLQTQAEGPTTQTSDSILSIAANSPGEGQPGRIANIAGGGGEEGNGGGGGGYYGGLAKRNTGVNSNSGGGGGSGWVDPTSGVFSDRGGTRGVNAGDGRVQFTYLGP